MLSCFHTVPADAYPDEEALTCGVEFENESCRNTPNGFAMDALT